MNSILNILLQISNYGRISGRAKATHLEVPLVRRLLRHGTTTDHLFRETKPGVVAHTALTQLLAEDELLHNYVTTTLNEMWPAAAMVCTESQIP
jgi:hypothetical protein